MKRKPRVTQKNRPRNQKRDKQFVNTFVNQPSKTRSGIAYTKQVKPERSTGCIFGSLLNRNKNKNEEKRSHQLDVRTPNKCGCNQCLEKRREDELSTCTSSSSGGVSVLLRNESLKPSESKRNLEVSASTVAIDKNKSKRKYKKRRQKRRPKYCNCRECRGETKSKKNKKNKKPRKKMPKKARSEPARPLKSAMKFPYSTDEQFQRSKKDRRSKSLLKYVLQKMKTASETNLHPRTSFRKYNTQPCRCYKQCLEKIRKYVEKVIAEERLKSQNVNVTKFYKKFLPILCRVCRRKRNNKLKSKNCVSESTVPNVSAGPIRLDEKESTETLEQKRAPSSVLHPSAEKPKTRKCKYRYVVKLNRVKKPGRRRRNVRNTKKGKTSNSKRICKGSCAGCSGRQAKYKPPKKIKVKIKKHGSKSKWKILSDATIKRLKMQIQKRLVQNDVEKKSNAKSSSGINIAPMPRAWPMENTATKRKNTTKKQNDTSSKFPKLMEKGSLTLTEEFEKLGIKFQGAPVPSGRVPTYIAMVKTAIRDLKPFRLTGKDAISKYIEIRYHVKNDDLLSYVLKWLIDMCVLKKKGCQYYFSGKRLVKKETVAVVGCKQPPPCSEESETETTSATTSEDDECHHPDNNCQRNQPVCRYKPPKRKPQCKRPTTPACRKAPPPCRRARKPVCRKPKRRRTPRCKLAQPPPCRRAKQRRTPRCKLAQTPPCRRAKQRTPQCKLAQPPPCKRAKQRRTPQCKLAQMPPCRRAKQRRTPQCKLAQTPPCRRTQQRRTPQCKLAQPPPCRRARKPPCQNQRRQQCGRARTAYGNMKGCAMNRAPRNPPQCMQAMQGPCSNQYCSNECTCEKELNANKNRVKLRTRYVRRNGKIYKQEEFI